MRVQPTGRPSFNSKCVFIYLFIQPRFIQYVIDPTYPLDELYELLIDIKMNSPTFV